MNVEQLIEKGVAALSVCTCREGRNQHGPWRVIDMTCAACGDRGAKAKAVIDAVMPEITEAIDDARREVTHEPVAHRGAMITGKYFAVGCGLNEIALVVERTSPPAEVVQGEVINGAWDGTFTMTEGTVNDTGHTFSAPIIWQGDELIHRRPFEGRWMSDYGFAYVEEEIAAGRGVPA